nr:nucleoporin Nup37 isoform X2 [Doryrhamphus excisus]XP_057921822.1 nucleoporin Nup37 isoform X2 [Doryrhamphus excisus]XP_057921823.1 nucleoporin Nup37 isoform X2 [Doryrhamphus excisus]XP_057921824.1 nucleoporin Nup37 isoform X2 [Doryrhamphus excisus]XP_057921825.1 nucleoporin Nup37 isoform X2 [Doryrhamphus excisus]XP_057921826.1 nucleoporin Nup37 isoform X2 [Doryrhamphus excisus]XP_057921827.1 nucleoporin Nup37 isoform X2 [Doryrhamphus excisus]XP_057921828.1 nucleoporin Nup37 isoform X2 [D
MGGTRTLGMPDDASRSPSYTVPCDSYVHVVEFSPFASGTPASLLAYSGNRYVVVGTCVFQEEDMDVEGVEFNVLRVFQHELRVDALAWSPESHLDRIPIIRFCTAAADRTLRLLTSNLQDRHEVKVMGGHSSFINHLVFEPTEGKQIASVSDDHTCRVWDLDGRETTTFRLRSPGISVCWHPEDVLKLMVAEKKGTIRFYDLVTQQAILSLDSGQSALTSADWCLTNTIKVGAVACNDWLIWDITRSSYPQEKRPAHRDKAQQFKWSRANENLFATTGCPGKVNSQLLIHHLGHPQPVTIGSSTVGSGLSWHRTLPLCVIGGDRKLCFWMTEM